MLKKTKCHWFDSILDLNVNVNIAASILFDMIRFFFLPTDDQQLIWSDKRNWIEATNINLKCKTRNIGLPDNSKVDNRLIADCRLKSYLLFIWNQNIWTWTATSTEKKHSNILTKRVIQSHELNILCDSRG